MGLSPKVWGKEGWRFIHYVAVTYHPSKKEEYLQFFQNLPKILPCPVCGSHFKINMEKHPPKMGNAKELFDWTVDMHNFVNEMNGKKQLTYKQAHDELFKEFKTFKNDYKTSDFTNALLLSTISAGLLIVLVKGLIKK
jgi:hypothetical protein